MTFFYQVTSDERTLCPTCGQLQTSSVRNDAQNSISQPQEHSQTSSYFRLNQFLVSDFDALSMDGTTPIHTENGTEENFGEIQSIGDSENETNSYEWYIDYELEPGQLIFINTPSQNSFEDGNDNHVEPAMFMDYHSFDDATFIVLNLNTE